jgi:aconitate hydratase
VTPELFKQQYGNVYNGNATWNAIPSVSGDVYQWDNTSTYVHEPPYFVDFSITPAPVQPVKGARVLGVFGDSLTTDHISPAGDIALNTPAADYLLTRGVAKADFNSYGARRGNHEVMIRGTFANIRVRNQLVPADANGKPREGGITVYLPTGEVMSIYDASMKYQASGTPLVILAGKEYGTGSSRDWAAKGTVLLGVKAVIAESFERIHRSNLVMMGVLPLTFQHGATCQSLGLTGHETFDLIGVGDNIQPLQDVNVVATAADGSKKEFTVTVRLNTPVEVGYYKNGGILQTVLRKFMS